MKGKIIKFAGSVPKILEHTTVNLSLAGWPAAAAIGFVCIAGVACFAIYEFTKQPDDKQEETQRTEGEQAETEKAETKQPETEQMETQQEKTEQAKAGQPEREQPETGQEQAKQPETGQIESEQPVIKPPVTAVTPAA